MSTRVTKGVKRATERPDLAFLWLVGISLVLYAVLLVSFQSRFLGDSLLDASANIATSVGLLLVAAGVALAAAALAQSARGTDLRIAAARSWLENRRRMVAALDYAMFSSPYIVGETNIGKATDQPVSKTDVVKSLFVILGAMRRLRDALANYPQSQGFLLAELIMHDIRNGNSGLEESERDVYLEAYGAGVQPRVAKLLHYNMPWMFGRSAHGGPSISLNQKTMMQAYTQLMSELDYLLERSETFAVILEDSDRSGSNACQLDQPSAKGSEMLASLVETLKNIHCHVAVLRAYLEYEWSAAFPESMSASKLEDRISELLAAGDWDSFVQSAESDDPSEDCRAGYRFGSALLQLGKIGVFDEGTALTRTSPLSGPLPARLRRLYFPDSNP